MKGELFRAVYDKMNVWPTNLAADRPTQQREATGEIYFQVIWKLQEDGVQVPLQGQPAETAKPKAVPAAPARPVTVAPVAAATAGSLKDYILGRTANLSAGKEEDRADEDRADEGREDEGREDEDRSPLAAE